MSGSGQIVIIIMKTKYKRRCRRHYAPSGARLGGWLPPPRCYCRPLRGGQPESNRRASTDAHAGDVNAPAVRLHDFAHDGEAKSCATLRPAHLIDLIEALANARQLVRRDADSGIFHEDFNAAIGNPRFDLNAAILGRVVDGIAHQIHEYLRETVSV